ncbi:uncharacterized protein LOC122297038 [Carya illinoinensis]|uniref:uncharacterized protein LOC122297038 n=1 Tax=Carya illinoinensis TaxID=32201 RepID=UPI001C71DB66|nr:uncharacterized protein LOC122297038 [Carya illinoinensis]
MHENIWNDKVQNPLLLWKGLYGYDATLFSENQLSYFHDFLKVKEMVKWPDDEEEFAIDTERPQPWKTIKGFFLMVGVSSRESDIDDATVAATTMEFLKYFTDILGIVKGPNDDVRPRKKEEWVIDIEGPHYLEEISGIVLYVVIFFKEDVSVWDDSDIVDAKITSKITSNGSYHVCRIQEEVRLVNSGFHEKENRTGYFVWVGYSNLQSFELKVLDNLLVQFYPNHRGMVPFYESYRAKVGPIPDKVVKDYDDPKVDLELEILLIDFGVLDLSTPRMTLSSSIRNGVSFISKFMTSRLHGNPESAKPLLRHLQALYYKAEDLMMNATLDIVAKLQSALIVFVSAIPREIPFLNFEQR